MRQFSALTSSLMGSGTRRSASASDEGVAVKPPSPREDDASRLNRVFSSLAGSDAAETLGTTGVLALFEKELGVDPETDIEALVILDVFATESLMDVTRDEFVHGMRQLQIKDLASLKQALPRLTEQRVHSASEFKRFYAATYHRAKAPRSKVVAKEICVGLWPILLNTDAKRSRHADAFVKYVNSRDDIRFISADLWVRPRCCCCCYGRACMVHG